MTDKDDPIVTLDLPELAAAVHMPNGEVAFVMGHYAQIAWWHGGTLHKAMASARDLAVLKRITEPDSTCAATPEKSAQD